MGLRLQKKPDGYEDCKTLREIAEQSGLSITTINGRISVWKVKPVLFVTEKGIVYRLFAKEDAERLCAPLKTRNMPKDAAAKKKQEQKPTQEKQAQPKPPANGLLKKSPALRKQAARAASSQTVPLEYLQGRILLRKAHRDLQ